MRPADVDADEASLWRYRSSLVPTTPTLSLGEGWTPLVGGRWNGRPVEWKLDYVMPSGSFKDRGIVMMINYLVQAGVSAVHEDSSGNGGAALATYAAALGLPCRIFVPATTSAGKIVQISASGAEVVLVDGTREDVANAAQAARGQSFYASHNWQAHFLEGTKTLGFELWEQCGFSAPDCIVAPTGGGSVLLGCVKAFNELHAAGSINRLPRLYAVQAQNCAPLFRALREEKFSTSDVKPTIAEGIATARPVRASSMLAAIKATGGNVVAATEEEIGEATLALARRGLFVEPTSATAAAGLTKLLASGEIASNERVIVILTGSGLKATMRIGQLLDSEAVPRKGASSR